MKVTVDKAPYFTVKVERRTGEELSFSPKDAYAILKGLELKAMQLHDLVANYYECSECGGLHRKGTKPHQEPEESEDE